MADLDLCKGDPGVTKIILDIAFKALVLAPFPVRYYQIAKVLVMCLWGGIWWETLNGK